MSFQEYMSHMEDTHKRKKKRNQQNNTTSFASGALALPAAWGHNLGAAKAAGIGMERPGSALGPAGLRAPMAVRRVEAVKLARESLLAISEGV